MAIGVDQTFQADSANLTTNLMTPRRRRSFHQSTSSIVVAKPTISYMQRAVRPTPAMPKRGSSAFRPQTARSAVAPRKPDQVTEQICSSLVILKLG